MNYQVLIDGVKAVIKQNGNEEITGDLLQQTLLAMISALGVGYQFVGVATPDTVPGTPDARVCYLCVGAGNYANFGTQFVLDGTNIAICRFDSVWTNVLIDIPSKSSVVLIRDLAPETGNSETLAMSQKAITEELAKKVDKVAGKGLSTNDFTNELRDIVESALTTNDVERELGQSDTKVLSQKAITNALAAKVDEVEGKGLSTNDFTDELKAIVDAALTTDDIVSELGESDTKVLSQAAITSILSGYAKISGRYQQMIVGSAESLAAKTAIAASFLRRISGGGASIGTGAALLKAVKGKSIVWNQYIKNGNFVGIANWVGAMTKTASGNILTATSVAGTGNTVFQNVNRIVPGHKYLISFEYKSDKTLSVQLCGAVVRQYASTNTWSRKEEVYTPSSADNGLYFYNYTSFTDGEWTLQLRNVIFIDLTVLGLGDLTVAQFRALYSLDYYAYNPGEVLPFAGERLRTTGANQWDEEWLQGYHNSSTGAYISTNNQITSKNPTRVIAGKTYYCNKACTWYFYDSEMNFLSAEYKSTADTITIPSGTEYAHFGWGTGYGATYLNNICINLSNPAINGQYFPYETHDLAVNPATIKDKDGNLVFPYGGMHGKGTAFDAFTGLVNGFYTKGRRVLVKVDLGSLNWSYASGFFNSSSLNSVWAKTANMICPLYEAMPNITYKESYVNSNKIIFYGTSDNLLFVRDTTYTDAAAFKAAMQGVELVFELATPVEVELETPVPATFYVNQYGTEEWLPENTDEPYTAPCDLEVQYPVDAVGTLENLWRNFISAEDFDAYNTALANALASVGITMTYVRTPNDTTKRQDFTITMAQS